MSTPRGWSSGWPGGQSVRIGDAEREAASRALGEHFAAGRLTREEFDERSSRVWSARTGSDLRPLFADLPGPQPGSRQARFLPPPPVKQPPRPRVPVMPVFLVVLGLALLLHIPGPLILLVLAAWWWTASVRWRHRRAHWAARWHGYGTQAYGTQHCGSRRRD